MFPLVLIIIYYNVIVTANAGIITLHINGMKIVTNPYSRTYNYQHIYDEGETTRITCEIRNNDLTLYTFYNETCEISSGPRKVNETLFLKKEDNMTEFECGVTDNDKKIIIETVIITFIQSLNVPSFNKQWFFLSVGIGTLVIILIIIAVIVINKRNKKQCSDGNDINLVSREMEPLPYTSQRDEPNSSQQTESNDNFTYSEVYYEPSFNIPRNNYKYKSDSLYEEIGDSVFDTVVARLEMAEKRRINQHDYENLKEIGIESSDGYCIMHPFRKNPLTLMNK